MLVDYSSLHNILIQNFGWLEVSIELLDRRWNTPGLGKIWDKKTLKHPTKKLYYRDGIFSKSWRVRRGRAIDMLGQYAKVFKNWELDMNTGIISHDDVVGINLK